MKDKIICCTVGMLLGDAWMTVPALRDLCSRFDVSLVCGTYAEPVYAWSAANIVGCNWTLIRTILDPDDHRSAFCPGFGFRALNPALKYVRAEYPNDVVYGWQEIGSAYQYPVQARICPPVTLRAGAMPAENGHVVIHAYTAHDWKNCDMIVDRAEYHTSVYAVGLMNERKCHLPQRDYIYTFGDICQSILACRGFVGVLSAWTNFAALFHKPQIVVSFTPDVQVALNPNARVLVKPAMQELQAEIDRMGL